MMVLVLVSLTSQAQTKFCKSYADYKAGQWKPYEELIPGKEPDSIRVKYDGQDFTLKTSDKEVNKAIKHDVFMMQIDKQLFITSVRCATRTVASCPSTTSCVPYLIRAISCWW